MSRPSSLRIALNTPICGRAVGRYSYMNFQMMEAATIEIAMGRKISALAKASTLARSMRIA